MCAINGLYSAGAWLQSMYLNHTSDSGECVRLWTLILRVDSKYGLRWIKRFIEDYRNRRDKMPFRACHTATKSNHMYRVPIFNALATYFVWGASVSFHQSISHYARVSKVWLGHWFEFSFKSNIIVAHNKNYMTACVPYHSYYNILDVWYGSNGCARACLCYTQFPVHVFVLISLIC